jgi:long-subunit fatty acid transport protein
MFRKGLTLLVLIATLQPVCSSWAGGFESFGVGSRQLGMGGAAVGLADDWRAIYWNPAGLAFLKDMAGGTDIRANFVEGWSNHSLKNVESPNRLLGDFQIVYPTEPREFNRKFDSTTVNRSPFTMRLSGDADVTNTLAGVAQSGRVVQRMFYPTRIGAGIAVKPFDKLIWTADVNWIDWSHLTIQLNYDPETMFTPDSRVDYDFKDTTAFRTGLEYLLPKGWSVRAGIFTDPSPYADEWGSLVTARFSDANVLTCGVGKQVGSLSFDVLYGYAFTERREVGGVVYDGKQNNFAVGVTLAF